MGLPEEVWRRAILSNSANISQAIQNLDQNAIKIIIIADENGVLEGTISDGDIRRGLLRGLNLNSNVDEIINRNAFVVTPDLERDFIMQLMIANKIQQIPVVDNKRRIVGLHLWDEVSNPPVRSNMMVIMAGGKGIRLRPHTENCPKPMLEVSGKPMLEHIIERGKLEGFSHFIIAIHYLGHIIESYFEDGQRLGVRIEYLRENSPLGTAGALSLLSWVPTSPFIVTNGDVMTDIRFGEMLDFHMRHAAAATMAVRMHEWQNPYGVVQTNGIEIIGFDEKPVVRNHINAGVYVLEPLVLSALAKSMYCDMPVLFQKLHAMSHRTVAYPMHEPWLDVGRPDDLRRANEKN